LSRARPPQSRVTLSEEDGVRFLHFGTEWVQGAMRIARPWRLELEYQRRMMATALLAPAPREVLQLGLGAAGLTRFCLRHLPRARVTVVERDPAVVRVAHRWFRLPAPGERLRIVEGDAGAHVAAATESADWLQVDLYDARARGPVLDGEAFYRDCRAALRPGGAAAFNLFRGSLGASLGRIDGAFGGRWMSLPATPEGNCIVVAAAPGGPLPARATLHARARRMESALGLAATAWLEGARLAWLPVGADLAFRSGSNAPKRRNSGLLPS